MVYIYIKKGNSLFKQRTSSVYDPVTSSFTYIFLRYLTSYIVAFFLQTLKNDCFSNYTFFLFRKHLKYIIFLLIKPKKCISNTDLVVPVVITKIPAAVWNIYDCT